MENEKLLIKYMKTEPKAERLFYSHVVIPAKKLEIKIPKDMVNKIFDISVEVSTSHINIKDISVKTLNIDSIDGDIELSNISSNDFKVVNTDGNITLSSINTEGLSCVTYSGDITFSGSCSKFKIKSTDGNVDIRDEKLPEAIDVDTDSGDVKFTIPNDNITLEYETDSGEFSSELPILDNGSNNQYSIVTVDGDIEIKVLQ